MAAEITGTPAAVTWGSAQDPTSQNVTVEADASHAFLTWTFWPNTDGMSVTQWPTLNGLSPDENIELARSVGDESATGAHVWRDPPSGTQAVDLSWEDTVGEGPNSFFGCVRGAASALVDIDTNQGAASEAISVTLSGLKSGDLCIKHDMVTASSPPSNTSGWNSLATITNVNLESSRLAWISASGSTQDCPSEDEAWSTIVAFAFTAGMTGVPGGGGDAFGAWGELAWAAVPDAAASGAFSLNLESGSYTITGSAATLLADRFLNAASGSYTLTGFLAALERGFSINAEAGAYVITGQAATLLADRLMNAEPGTYTITGAVASLLADRLLVADSGVYVITGVDAELLHTVLGAFELNAEPGVYTIQGIDATFVYVPSAAGEGKGSLIITRAGGRRFTMRRRTN